jgi:hypothetical protein
VDGFNLYHSVKGVSGGKWLDIRKLFGLIYPHLKNDLTIYYFTALANWLPESMRRHKIFIRALEFTQIIPLYGKFKPKERYCNRCERNYWGHEEKESDVYLASKLVQLAYDDAYEIGIVLSGDNDLTPAIRIVRERFPEKMIGVLLPIGRKAKRLKTAASFNSKITADHIRASLFPSEISISITETIYCPPEWVE